MFLFFDTETTGLPIKWDAPVSDTYNWPRMVQIAWLVCDLHGERISSENFIIQPEGYSIPIGAENVHGISTERAIKEGVELRSVLNLFNQQLEKSDYLVAHNINFDEKIVGAELYRKNIESELFNKAKICTMLQTTEYCMIPGKYGYKWPKLSELHIELFGKDFEEAHDASVDIEITAKCFWKLRDRGIL